MCSEIRNNQYLQNQSLKFHLSQIAINCKIQNETRLIKWNGFRRHYELVR